MSEPDASPRSRAPATRKTLFTPPTQVSPLFSQTELSLHLSMEESRLEDRVNEKDRTQMLSVDAEEWVERLVEEFRLVPPKLRTNDRHIVDVGERQVRVVVAREGPFGLVRRWVDVPGWAAELHIPFDGDAALLDIWPDHVYHAWPRAEVQGNEIRRKYEWSIGRPQPDLDREADDLQRRIEPFVAAMAEQVEAHNAALAMYAREAIARRRERVLTTQSQLYSLQVPVRRRDDAPTTYQAPGIERSSPPVPPPCAPERAKMPEPVLIEKFYEHIVRLIRSWAKAMERTPDPFREMDEETLRAALLPMLNSHYEGGATAETFNAAGKTDVLVRVEDKNVFIGECKWWKGETSLKQALAQIFSYGTWRDTKLALLLFVDRKEISAVVEKARATLQAHDLFIDWRSSDDERELRCRMKWPTDREITATLHVSFVHLPLGHTRL